MRVGIIGAGITGLSAAYDLVKRGHTVAVFERSPEVGGQVSTFEIGGGRVERFYHHLFTSDTLMIRLIQELGLGESLEWLESKVGLYYGGKLYNFVTPMDLLRFTPLSLVERLRLGLVALYLQRLKAWRRLEPYTAEEWIKRWAGPRAHQVVWEPLLRGKFGASASEVGMVWFWGKLYVRFGSRSGGMRKERLGYPRGSFGVIYDELARRIGQAGGEVHLKTPASRVLVEEGRVVGLQAQGAHGETMLYPCEAVIATVLSPLILRLVPELRGEYAAQLAAARYKTAVCVVFVLKRALSHIYWLNVSDGEMPFVAAIEQTNLVPSSRYGGKHILYLSNYLSPESPLYHLTEEEMYQLFAAHLPKINPEFEGSWIEERYCFRDPAGQPLITPNYSRLIPDLRSPIPGLYVANTTQVYPEDRGQNYGVRLANQVVQALLEDAPVLGPPKERIRA